MDYHISYQQQLVSDVFNRIFGGVMRPGVYCGFYSVFNLDELSFTHNAGNIAEIFQYDKNEDVIPNSGFAGFVRFPQMGQATLFEADMGDFVIEVSANASGNPRIDTVYIRRAYSESSPQPTITIALIPGTPDPNPVAPALDNAATDIKLGELLVPTGYSTNLTTQGAVYTRKSLESFAQRDGDYVNVFDTLQKTEGQKLFQSTAFGSATYAFVSNTVTHNGDGNVVHWDFSGTLNTIADRYSEPDYADFYMVHNTDVITVTNAGNIITQTGADYVLRAGSRSLWFWNDATSKWYFIVFSDKQAYTDLVNQHTKTVELGQAASTQIILSNNLTLDDNGNSFIISGTSPVNWITEKQDGAEITLYSLVDVVIKHIVSTPPPGSQSLVCPKAVDYFLAAGDNVRLQASNSGWYVVSEPKYTPQTILETATASYNGTSGVLTVKSNIVTFRTVNDAPYVQKPIKKITIESWMWHGFKLELFIDNVKSGVRIYDISNGTAPADYNLCIVPATWTFGDAGNAAAGRTMQKVSFVLDKVNNYWRTCCERPLYAS